VADQLWLMTRIREEEDWFYVSISMLHSCVNAQRQQFDWFYVSISMLHSCVNAQRQQFEHFLLKLSSFVSVSDIILL